MIDEREISILGIKTNYKIAGQGFPLLILHGWNGSSDSWKKVIRFLEKKFKIVCPDFPGFGKSDPPKEPWNLDNFTQWLKNFVDGLNLENFFLLGHSFGGRVAIKFSILYPEKVKKLILVSSAGVTPKINLKTVIIFQLARIGNAFFSAKPLLRFKEGARNFFYLFLKNKDYVKAKGVMRETMKKILNEDLLPVLPQIRQETILIWGEKDKLVPVKYAKVFQERIENSRMIILPKVGHSPHLECPFELFETLINFLKS